MQQTTRFPRHMREYGAGNGKKGRVMSSARGIVQWAAGRTADEVLRRLDYCEWPAASFDDCIEAWQPVYGRGDLVAMRYFNRYFNRLWSTWHSRAPLRLGRKCPPCDGLCHQGRYCLARRPIRHEPEVSINLAVMVMVIVSATIVAILISWELIT